MTEANGDFFGDFVWRFAEEKVFEFYFLCPEVRVVQVTGNIDNIFFQIFFYDIVRKPAAKIKPVALTEGIENRAVVEAKNFVCRNVADFSRV